MRLTAAALGEQCLIASLRAPNQQYLSGDPASNEMHIFQSDNIWFDPTDYIPGKTLEVLVDPNRPHRYLVETSFLPKVV